MGFALSREYFIHRFFGSRAEFRSMLDRGRFPFNPKVLKFRLVHQKERTISVWSARNIRDQL